MALAREPHLPSKLETNEDSIHIDPKHKSKDLRSRTNLNSLSEDAALSRVRTGSLDVDVDWRVLDWRSVEGDVDQVVALNSWGVGHLVGSIRVVDSLRWYLRTIRGSDDDREVVASNWHAAIGTVASLDGELSRETGLVSRLQTLTVGEALTWKSAKAGQTEFINHSI